MKFEEVEGSGVLMKSCVNALAWSCVGVDPDWSSTIDGPTGGMGNS